MRKEGGVIADSVHRDPDDPNMIIIYNKYTDLSTAQESIAAMTSSEEWQSVLKKAGVKPETLEMWVGEDV